MGPPACLPGSLLMAGIAAPEVIASDNWWVLGITLPLFPLMFTGLRISRLEGIMLLGVYGAYLGLLLAR